MAKRVIEVKCKKCDGKMYLGKGNKQPCPKCQDERGIPTGKFKKEVEDGSSAR